MDNPKRLQKAALNVVATALLSKRQKRSCHRVNCENKLICHHKTSVNVGGKVIDIFPKFDDIKHLHVERLTEIFECKSMAAIYRYCDDYCPIKNEIFFERDSESFNSIITCLQRSGRIYLSKSLCPMSFIEELDYWKIDQARLDYRCQEKIQHLKHQKTNLQNLVIAHTTSDLETDTKESKMKFIRNILEQPRSSNCAKAWTILNTFVIILSLLCFVFRSEFCERNGYRLHQIKLIDGLELFCVTCE